MSPLQLGRERMASGDLHGALDAFQDALAQNGDDPELVFETAGLLRALDQHADALSLYDALAEALPDTLPVLHNRATCLVELGRFTEAVQEFLRIVRRWDAAPCWAGLGEAAYAANDPGTGRRAYRTAIALAPERTGSYANFGESLAESGDDSGAAGVLRRAVALSPDDPTLHLNLARTLLSLGEYEGGWAEYEWRRHPSMPNSIDRAVHARRWEGESLDGKHLFIAGEQGIGDQIWFLPFVREAAGRARMVTIEVAPKLVPLVRQSFPDAAVQALQVERRDGRWRALGSSRSGPPDADAWTDLASLAGFLWDTVAGQPQAPALRPAPELVARWKARLDALGPGPRIGVCWRSPLTRRGRWQQYLPLSAWAPILRAGPAQFVCLQHGDCADEVARVRDELGVCVHILPELDPWDGIHDVAATAVSLDLIVSAGTWISMLGGALGVPTLLVGNGRWVAPQAGRDPVHGSVEPIFRTIGTSWPDGVVAEVAARIRARL